MKIFVETERLLLREIVCEDANDLFEMDADPEVHRYIQNKPVQSVNEIADIISRLQKQYRDNGIARWAVVNKTTGECVGWSGLKYFDELLHGHSHFYELGYRFKQKHWGKGFATESSKAVVAYGFEKLGLNAIFAITDHRNTNSQKVLAKVGFTFKETFDHEGDETDWFELKREDWPPTSSSI